MSNLNINVNPKLVIAMMVLIGVAALAYKIPETKAQSSTVITGVFGCIENSNATPYLEAKKTQDAWMNRLAHMNFDTNTISVMYSINTNFNSNGTAQRNETGSTTFTVTTGPITGSYTVTYPATGGTITVMPVNSGNTLLYIDSKTGPDHMSNTGVCQRI